MILTPEIIALLIIDAIFLFLATLAFFLSLPIIFKWDITSLKPLQYKLEKRAVLIATIIKYIFFLKLLLFLFFIFSADKISGAITGAMCAAGVVNSVSFGLWMFTLKIVNLFLFGFWLVLHKQDLNHENLPFTHTKFIIFAVAYFWLLVEVLLQTSFFTSLDVDKIVSCCGTLFSATTSSSISSLFELGNSFVVSLFYGSYLLVVIAFFLKNPIAFILTNVLFFLVSILALILFFSTYVYELPTHNCPFCLLQKDYFYVGYAFYVFLFIGTFSGISGGLVWLLDKSYSLSFYKTSFVFNTLYMLLCSAYPLSYYFRNGVWL